MNKTLFSFIVLLFLITSIASAQRLEHPRSDPSRRASPSPKSPAQQLAEQMNNPSGKGGVSLREEDLKDPNFWNELKSLAPAKGYEKFRKSLAGNCPFETKNPSTIALEARYRSLLDQYTSSQKTPESGSQKCRDATDRFQKAGDALARLKDNALARPSEPLMFPMGEGSAPLGALSDSSDSSPTGPPLSGAGGLAGEESGFQSSSELLGAQNNFSYALSNLLQSGCSLKEGDLDLVSFTLDFMDSTGKIVEEIPSSHASAGLVGSALSALGKLGLALLSFLERPDPFKQSEAELATAIGRDGYYHQLCAFRSLVYFVDEYEPTAEKDLEMTREYTEKTSRKREVRRRLSEIAVCVTSPQTEEAKSFAEATKNALSEFTDPVVRCSEYLERLKFSGDTLLSRYYQRAGCAATSTPVEDPLRRFCMKSNTFRSYLEKSGTPADPCFSADANPKSVNSLAESLIASLPSVDSALLEKENANRQDLLAEKRRLEDLDAVLAMQIDEIGRALKTSQEMMQVDNTAKLRALGNLILGDGFRKTYDSSKSEVKNYLRTAENELDQIEQPERDTKDDARKKMITNNCTRATIALSNLESAHKSSQKIDAVCLHMKSPSIPPFTSPMFNFEGLMDSDNREKFSKICTDFNKWKVEPTMEFYRSAVFQQNKWCS